MNTRLKKLHVSQTQGSILTCYLYTNCQRSVAQREVQDLKTTDIL